MYRLAYEHRYGKESEKEEKARAMEAQGLVLSNVGAIIQALYEKIGEIDLRTVQLKKL